MKKTITIEYDGLETSIKWSNLTPIEALGILRYHEKNVFVGLLNYNESRKEDEVTLKKDEIYIQDLGLSERTINCLRGEGIKTLTDLCKYDFRDLIRIRNFGNKSLHEIQVISEKYNLNLK